MQPQQDSIFLSFAHLVHASLIESHYGGVGQPIKHSPECLFGVKLLWFEKLLQELFVEHGSDDVIHDYSVKQIIRKHQVRRVGKINILHCQLRSRRIR